MAVGFVLGGAPAAQAAFSFLDETAQNGGTTSHENAPRSWLTNAVSDWMGSLPDGKELNRISIPGTHDSGAQCCGLGVKTQTWTFSEQLSAGIRFFDVRVRRTGNAWAIHHSANFLNMMFGDIMNQVVAFLRAHPREVVLMRIKEDHSAQSGSDSHATIWASYMRRYGSYVYPTTAPNRPSGWPTLGQARGKIFVLSQISEVGGSAGKSWPSSTTYKQDYYKVYMFAHDQTKNSDWATLPAKKRLVKAYIDRARQVGTGGGYPIFNFLSGAYGMTPDNHADHVNDTAYNHIAYAGYPRMNGVLIMDFPGDRLVYRIIKSNFTSTTMCAARTFRTVSAKTWAEFRLPRRREGTTININGGAYNRYVFPKCNRVHWSDLTFYCGSNGAWSRTRGSWGADAACHGSRGNSPYVFTGNR